MISEPKLFFKHLRHRFRRLKVKLKDGTLDEMPIFFANSFPKSGTHLLTQVLLGFTKIGPAVNAGLPAILTYEGPSGRTRRLSDILSDLERLRPGDIAYGHLHARSELISHLCQEGMATYFIYRDPRDVVVSHAHYVTYINPQHVHHRYYTTSLNNLDERIQASILGRPDIEIPFPDIRARFEPYLGWLERGEVMSLRYEDFVLRREKFFGQVIEHAERRGFPVGAEYHDAILVLEDCVNPDQSPTYRSGRVGRWREVFSPMHTAHFKRVAGDLLVRLGYERDDNW